MGSCQKCMVSTEVIVLARLQPSFSNASSYSICICVQHLPFKLTSMVYDLQDEIRHISCRNALPVKTSDRGLYECFITHIAYESYIQ